MTLRTRLVIGLALVSAVLGLVVLLVPRSVERAQIRQLDRQLISVSPRATLELGGAPTQAASADESFSDLYIALVRADGSRVVFIESQLAPGRSPALPRGAATPEPTMATVDSADGASGAWRVAMVTVPEAGSVVLNSMLDQQVAVEDRLRVFVSDASHELRTPVAAIKGFTDLYRNGDLTGDQLEEAMRRIGQESRRMEVLVDDLLLLARLDEGRSPNLSAVDVSSLVEDAVLDAAATHPSRTVTTDRGPGLVVAGDEAHLRQVLANLVNNALVHAGSEATVTISAHAAGGVCAIEVADDGVGMDADGATHAFDRFWRSDTGRVRNRAGAGLGLSIVRAIVEAHDGRVTLDTAPGRGTRVRVALPLARDAQ